MKKIFLALTGSIACIKAFDVIKQFQEKNFEVQCILTKGGEKFSSRLALESISRYPVLGPNIFEFEKQNPFEKNTEKIFAHLELSKESEALVIAPCSANTIEKISTGKADDFLSTAILAYTKKIFLAPAMNTKMWENKKVQENIKDIEKKNIKIIQPQSSGKLACGEEGIGKMANIDTLVESVERELSPSSFFGKKFLLNLGGTQEKIDPVRYLGNFSTGKTGEIFAKKIFQMGGTVSIVEGNSKIKINTDIFFVEKVQSTEEMKTAMEKKFLESDVIIFSAAVVDFVPEKFSAEKIKKKEVGEMSFVLKQNIDIAKYFAEKKLSHQLFIGFALETGDEEFLKKSLQKKAEIKKFDIILGNTPENFGTDKGNFLVYFSYTKTFQKFSGKKEVIFEEILKIVKEKFLF